MGLVWWGYGVSVVGLEGLGLTLGYPLSLLTPQPLAVNPHCITPITYHSLDQV